MARGWTERDTLHACLMVGLLVLMFVVGFLRNEHAIGDGLSIFLIAAFFATICLISKLERKRPPLERDSHLAHIAATRSAERGIEIAKRRAAGKHALMAKRWTKEQILLALGGIGIILLWVAVRVLSIADKGSIHRLLP